MTTTTPIPAGSAAGGTTASRQMTGTDRLGKQDFLKLLIAQLRNQDPMKPMEDREFISQLAQFSALEATQSLSSQLEASLGVQLLSQAAGFIGKRVEARLADGTQLAGTVGEVRLAAGKPELVVDGRAVALDQITRVGGQIQT